MTLEMKHCNGCGEDKPLNEFNFRNSGRYIGKPRDQCKKCSNACGSVWRKANPIRANEIARNSSYRHGVKPASENKSCSSYLGCVIAETVLSHEFPRFKRMPYGNPDYDYECPRGYLIDVKSSRRAHFINRNDSWHFNIKKNKVATYFLFLAFSRNDEPLTPEHIWLIPGNVVNEKTGIVITATSKGLVKWSQYERSLENVLNCCNKTR